MSDEERTRIRGRDDRGAEAGSPDGGDAGTEDRTRIRGAGDEPALEKTEIMPRREEPEEDRTEILPPEESGDEKTRIRPDAAAKEDRTLMRPAAGATAGADEATELLGTGEDATRIRPAADEVEEATRIRGAAPTPVTPDADDEATRIRGTAPKADDDATRVRPGGSAPAMPADDDATVPAARGAPAAGLSDDDPTVAAFSSSAQDDDDATVPGATAAPPADDDPTLPASGRPASGRPGPSQGDNDPTVRGDTSAGSTDTSTQSILGKSQLRTVGVGAVLRGRFALEGKLGEGGMGGVYKAKDLLKEEARDRNPWVAVKVLNTSFVDHPNAYIALQREASRSQKLNHENIAGVFDFDRDGDVVFMSMELLEGDPLDKVIKRHKGGLDRETAFKIIHDISEALAYAHTRHKLVHSDFKPGNIFWTKNNIAKVFDFGIARAASGEPDEVLGQREKTDVDQFKDDGKDKTLFDAGELGALTPAYASREMFEGMDPAPQDDVYALGIVAYQCLTGKHPYNRKPAPQAEGLNMKVERPPNLTNRQWKALQRSLAFHREDRTPDAQVFLEEFFGEAQKWPWYMAAGFAVLAVGIYFALPNQTNVPVPPAWTELEATIDASEGDVIAQLATASAPGFDYSDGWGDATRSSLARWQDSARPVILVREFDAESDATELQGELFETYGIVTRVDLPAEGSGDRVRLVAGPFPGEAGAAIEELEDTVEALRDAGEDPRTQNDLQDIERARAAVVGVYLAHARKNLPDDVPVLTSGSGSNLELDTAAVGAANRRLIDFEDIRDALITANAAYGPVPEIADYVGRYETAITAWQEHISSEQLAQVQRDQAGVVAAQQQAREAQLRADRERLEREQAAMREQQYADRKDGVLAVFAGQCDNSGSVSAAMADFGQLRDDDQTAALNALNGCMQRRIGLATASIEATKGVVLAALGSAHAAQADAIRGLRPPDPCSSRAYVGNGNVQPCIDDLASGGSGPAMVVVPAPSGGSEFAIGRYEVSVGDYNAFCSATGCGDSASGPSRLPATGIPVSGARAYAEWLSSQTGFTYRLPTLTEWQHAASANGAELDSNRNCYSSVRGVVKGERLVNATQGTANPWGLINHVGNAQEWVTGGGSLMVAGGKHTDPLAECTVSTSAADDGSADPATGFRLVREIGD